jgi:hypothetical protein
MKSDRDLMEPYIRQFKKPSKGVAAAALFHPVSIK